MGCLCGCDERNESGSKRSNNDTKDELILCNLQGIFKICGVVEDERRIGACSINKSH